MRMNNYLAHVNCWHILLLIFIFGITGTLLFTSCSTSVGQECESGTPCIPAEHEPHEKLADYDLFSGDLRELKPVEGLLPYDLNTQLFSDYSRKQRFIHVPYDKKIELSGENDLVFPPGTVLVKNFFYPDDARTPATGRTIIETRLLIRYDDSWQPNTYVWNPEQTGARLLRTGDEKPITWTDYEGVLRSVRYKIPSVNDCGSCHRKNGEITPLGPKIRNLNKLYSYVEGSVNQLDKWNSSGFFNEDLEPNVLPRLPVWNDAETGSLNMRARAYLDVNCSSCHNDLGSARNSGLYLTYEEEDVYRLGVCKIPVAAGSAGVGLKYGIVPGEPEQSILLHRMNSTDPNVRMPEIGRTLIHNEAVELIKEWIASMDLPPCGD